MAWRRSSTPRDAPSGAEADMEDVRAAYMRGRRDERASRRRHPLMMTLTVLAAGVGAVVLAMAAKEGSFGRGGEAVDRGLSVAADRAEPAVRSAAGEAGEAIRDTGQSVRDRTDGGEG